MRLSLSRSPRTMGWSAFVVLCGSLLASQLAQGMLVAWLGCVLIGP